MYVPAGWWHAVLNLDTTIAVTQNFAEPRNFDNVWAAMAKGRGDLIPELYKQLCKDRPELAARADAMGGVAAVQEQLEIPDLFLSLLEVHPGQLDSDDESDDE